MSDFYLCNDNKGNLQKKESCYSVVIDLLLTC